MFEKILVPLDGSEQAIPIARDLALQLGSTIHLIHAVSVDHDLTAGRNVQPVQVVEIEVEQAHRLTEARVERGIKYVNQLLAQLKEAGVKVDSRANVPQGDPAQHIVDYVKANDIDIDLVVMSTHGQGGLRRLLVGSVTDRLIQTCEIPILVNPCH
jgi:nucleotide-binding universal stress UspA family protein